VTQVSYEASKLVSFCTQTGTQSAVMIHNPLANVPFYWLYHAMRLSKSAPLKEVRGTTLAKLLLHFVHVKNYERCIDRCLK